MCTAGANPKPEYFSGSGSSMSRLIAGVLTTAHMKRKDAMGGSATGGAIAEASAPSRYMAISPAQRAAGPQLDNKLGV